MYGQAWLDYSKPSKETDRMISKIDNRIQIDPAFLKDVCIHSAIREYELFSGRIVDKIVGTENLDHKFSIYLKQISEPDLGGEGYIINVTNKVVIAAKTSAGILYGMFRFIEVLRSQEIKSPMSIESVPSNDFRMVNHWDNMDGSIERGYSGDSFFFSDHQLIVNERTHTYARLMASIGINSVAINNVNVKDEANFLMTRKHLKPLVQLAQLFESYNIKLFLSINYAAPIEFGELESADPLDPSFISWWDQQSKWLFEHLPNFGGYLVKADSEGRPGPFTYGRTQADGANMLAKAVGPYGGLVVWRCFVYNCQQDWRDTKTDRAKAGYEAFMPLDGKFMDNVILQIKNGPMDFQVREPVSPLFGAMKATNQFLEVQAAQEYTGQQRHLCYLVPMWKEILEFDTCHDVNSKVKDIISGKTYKRQFGGMVAVINTGNNENWTGHDLAAANWYGFGKLAWDTNESPESIAQNFVRLTYGLDPLVEETITKLLLTSWSTYESYTSPLGIGWMVNPNHHYGPNVDGYEYDRWGTYHRSTNSAIGVDRTNNGTNYTGQYHETWTVKYSDLHNCPIELLLFFHRVDYKYVLPSGQTLIQYIYDTHFDGAMQAESYYASWLDLESKLENTVYKRVRDRFLHQKEHARLWCDVINSYFFRKTGIKDKWGRKLY